MLRLKFDEAKGKAYNRYTADRPLGLSIAPRVALRYQISRTGTRQFFISPKCPRTGRQLYVFLGNHPAINVDRAADLARREIAEIHNESPEDDDGATLAEVFERYLERRELRPASVRSYRSRFKTLADAIGDPVFSEITARDMRRVVERFGHRVRTYEALHLTKILWRAEGYPSNEWPGANVPVSLRRPDVAVFESRADAAKGYRAAAAWPDRANSIMTRIQFLTGCRVGELRSLEWDNVYLDSDPAYFILRETKQGAVVRIPIVGHVVDLFEAMRGQHPRWVFPGKTRASYLRSHRGIWESISKAVGYRLTSHATRRFFIGECAALRVDPGIARLLTGHTSGGSDVHGAVYMAAGIVNIDVLAEAAEPVVERIIGFVTSNGSSNKN